MVTNKINEKPKLLKVNSGLLKNYINKFFIYIRWPAVIVVLGSLLIWTVNKKIKHISWNATLILQYISVLRWPVVALTLLLLLKPHIPELMKRVKKAGWASAKVEFETSQLTQTSNADIEEQQTLKVIAEDVVSAKDDSTVSPPGSATTDASPPAENLLDNESVQLAFEKIYRDMYGTQFEALQLLHGYQFGVASQDLMPFFIRHQQSTPNAYTDLLGFMSYLSKFSLVTYNGQTQIFTLTHAGTLFLEYFSKLGSLNFKPF